jgi:Sulfatase
LRKAILVTIDGWGTNFVGTYGNSLCATPHLDRFAAFSKVFDRAYTTSPSLDAALQSISNGRHPLEPPPSGRSELAEILQMLGKQSIFLTDDPEVVELPWVQSFNESFCFDPTSDEGVPAEHESSDLDPNEQELSEWTDTRMAMFLEAALGELARFSDHEHGLPDWTWLHLSGLAKTWDAPYEDRLQLCDEEDDPEPPHGMEPIAFEVNRETDPDAIFGAACVAAAQAKILDELWSWLDAFLNETVDRSDCLIILAGVRGYPLGEHRSVGFISQDLFSELIHTPLIIQPGKMPIGTRDDTLVQLTSIWTTVLQWLGDEDSARPLVATEVARRRVTLDLAAPPSDLPGVHESQNALPSICYVASEEATSLQVPRWSALWQHEESDETFNDPESIRLFLSPDDRWQQNDATSRAIKIAEAMKSTRDSYIQWLAAGCPIETQPTLPECLTHRV